MLVYSGNVPARVLKSVSVAWCDLRYLQRHKINEAELWFKDQHTSLMSFWIPLAWGRLLTWFTVSLFLSANGNLCWWRSKVDPSWTCAGGPFIKLNYLLVHVLLNITNFMVWGLCGLLKWQHYIKLKEEEKNRKLNDLLDALDFNQIVIFVKSVSRAAELDKLLRECNFPSICIHSGMSQEERYVLCDMKGCRQISLHWFIIDDLDR